MKKLVVLAIAAIAASSAAGRRPEGWRRTAVGAPRRVRASPLRTARSATSRSRPDGRRSSPSFAFAVARSIGGDSFPDTSAFPSSASTARPPASHTTARSSCSPRRPAEPRRSSPSSTRGPEASANLATRALVVRRDRSRCVHALPRSVLGAGVERRLQRTGIRPRNESTALSTDRRPRHRCGADAWVGCDSRLELERRWAYTLYAKQKGKPFVHALDTANRKAYCIDLPLALGQPEQMQLRLRLRADRMLDVRNGRAMVATVDTRSFVVHRH